MKSKERSKFAWRARAEYARLSAKKEKGALIDIVILLVGHKSRKQVIRVLGCRRNAHERKKPGVEKNTQSPTGGYAAADMVCYGVSMKEAVEEWIEGGKWNGALYLQTPQIRAAK